MKKIFWNGLVMAILFISCHTSESKDFTRVQATETPATNEDFGRQYALAWSSQHPDSVASFFSPNGSLVVNNGTPAVGRQAIAKTAESFMTAFPDMIVSMDSIPVTQKGTEFHWTLSGTNSGPGGTGKAIRIHGVEVWKRGADGLIESSDGSFDEAAYNRQLKEGMQKK